MRQRRPTALLGCGALVFAMAGAACGGGGEQQQQAATRGAPPRRNRADQAGEDSASGNRPGSPNAARGAADGGTAERPPPLPLTDGDFTESDRTRDPFRNYAREFIPVGPVVQVSQNQIKLREYGLEELHLIAVIVGTDNPYAMVTDPTGRGTIIRRGEYVGRPERIASGSGVDGTLPHEVPWRVSRIVGSRVRRDRANNLDEVPGEVVLEREDRLNPNAPRAERILTLAPMNPVARTDVPGGTVNDPNAPRGAPPLTSSFGPGGSPFLPTLPSSGSATGPGSATFVQSFTTPPAPATPPQPTTVVIQTGPQGQTTVTGPGAGSNPNPNVTSSPNGNPYNQPRPSAPQGPRDPYLPPPGGSNQPPPVVITGSPPLPSSGLP